MVSDPKFTATIISIRIADWPFTRLARIGGNVPSLGPSLAPTSIVGVDDEQQNLRCAGVDPKSGYS